MIRMLKYIRSNNKLIYTTYLCFNVVSHEKYILIALSMCRTCVEQKITLHAFGKNMLELTLGNTTPQITTLNTCNTS